MARRLSLLLVLVLAVAACSGDNAGTTSTTVGDGSVTTLLGDPGTTEASTQGSSTTNAPTWTDLVGVNDLPDEVQVELLDLVRKAEEIRELKFREPPSISVVTDEELERRVRELIEEDAGDYPADEALYKLLGLLGPDVDLATLLTDLYGEQVAGFYDGETGELVVPMTDEGFSVSERATLIHELTHSLTDQQFHFDPVMKAMFDEDRLDEASAFQGLVEGDASQVQYLYLLGLSQRELGEFLAEAMQVDTSALDAAPKFLQDALIFPYDTGLAFVQRLWSAGGWDAVNEAYVTFPDLPGSTEQVMSPGDYRRDLPAPVTLTEIDIPGYTLERQSVWGELGFRQMLDQVLGEQVGVEAADGWGGDAYYQWYDGTNAAFVVAYVGDTEADQRELEDALVDYAVTAVPEEDYVWVEEIDGQLYFIAADEPDVGLSILSAVKG